MSQQLAIIIMIDVAAAVKANTLKGNTYLFDNKNLQGSKGQGTDSLVSAIDGSHWFDGSQADEQVFNWLPYALGSIPPVVPKAFQEQISKDSDAKALDHLMALADKGDESSIQEKIKKISAKRGVRTKVTSKRKELLRGTPGTANHKIMDVTGRPIDKFLPDRTDVSQLGPIITDITGEAVDKKVMYVAEYGSPDFVTDGWYWSASVDSSKTGTFAYTMHIQLHQLSEIDGELTWVPINMTCEAYLKVTNEPKRNGFTGGGIGMLPIM